jgi:hypothetical protein
MLDNWPNMGTDNESAQNAIINDIPSLKHHLPRRLDGLPPVGFRSITIPTQGHLPLPPFIFALPPRRGHQL